MFKEIDIKLKAVAKLIFGLGIAVSLIIGICLIGFCGDGIKGGIIMTAGIFLSWIASFILFGLGELISKEKRICELLEEK